MGKKTLLEITQLLLSSLDSDEVNSISDTTESLQVARLVQTVYESMVDIANLPEVKTLFELSASADPDLPVVMYRPDNVLDVEWIKYNKYQTGTANPLFLEVEYQPLHVFLDHIYQFNTNNDFTFATTLRVNSDDIDIVYMNNKHPTYFTSFDDKTILFDSYYADYDSTLQKSKTIAYGTISQSFVLEDNFIPHLDERQFSLLINEAKSLAWAELKQTSHQKAEQMAKRGWAALQKTRRNVKANESQLDRLPNYARRVR